MSTIGSSSNLPSQPIFQGTQYKNKKKNMLQIARGEDLLIQAEYITRPGLMDKLFTKTKKITYYDTDVKANKTVYVKVNSVTSPFLGSKGKKALNAIQELVIMDSLNRQRAEDLQELVEVLPKKEPEKGTEGFKNVIQEMKSHQGAPNAKPAASSSHAKPAVPPRQAKPAASSAPPVPAELKELSDRIEKKKEQLKDIEIRVPSSQIVEFEGVQHKVRESSEPLDDLAKGTLIAYIEDNKEAWLAEADANESWITKKVPVGDAGVIKIEIFPSDRENVNKLGRIDIRMEFIDKGTYKKVFKSLNYEKGKVTAGIYGPTENVKGDVKAEKDIKTKWVELKAWAAENGWGKINKKVALSKAHDLRLKTTKNKGAQLKSKLTQPLLQDSLYNVFLTGVLPNGQLLDEKTKLQLMVSAFESLEHLHFMGKVHVDIKPENMMLIEKNGKYEVRIIDYGLSTDMNSGGVLRGTPGYIAPELLLDAATTGAVYTAVTDIYAMGVAFANIGLNVGQPDPWWAGADDPDTLVATVLNADTFSDASNRIDYPRLGQGAGYSDEFQQGLNMMTNFYADDRFQSATEAKEYFQELLNKM